MTSDPSAGGTAAPNATVGVALSGGGHRASAWALGALVYLSDIGVAQRVRSITSVSGGSITNGFVAVHCDYERAGAAAFAGNVAAPLASRIATHGTAFAESGARDILRTAIGTACLAVAAAVITAIASLTGAIGWHLESAQVSGTAFTVASLGTVVTAASALGLGLVWKCRAKAVRLSYSRALYTEHALDKLDFREVEHVFCATDIQFAEHVYLSSKFLYAYRLGVGRPDDELLVADAVLASAAFPAAFPPLLLPSKRFAFRGGADRLPEDLVLLDGGIYDNMADQWFLGMRKRLSGDDPDPNAKLRSDALRAVVALPEGPDELLIVNATAGIQLDELKPSSWVRLELEALLRAVLALHDNSSSLRRSTLVQSFMAAERNEKGQSGTLIHIETDASVVVDRVLREPVSTQSQQDRHARAMTLRRLLDMSLVDGARIDWPELLKNSRKVSTTLFPLGVATTASLLQHAYLLAATQTHLHLGYPLPPDTEWARLFGRERFVALAEGRG